MDWKHTAGHLSIPLGGDSTAEQNVKYTTDEFIRLLHARPGISVLNRGVLADSSRRNDQAPSGLQSAEPERTVQNEPLAKDEGETKSQKRFVVVVESRCRRLRDFDNPCAKFLTDSARYCGAIPDDSPREIESFKIFQTQVKTLEEECTILEITRIQ